MSSVLFLFWTDWQFNQIVLFFYRCVNARKEPNVVYWLVHMYNTTANKRISYSSRLFEVTCCRIRNGGGCQHPSIDCKLFVHCFVVYFFCCMGMVHPQYFIHYNVCIHSSGISLFFACYNGVRHAILKIFIWITNSINYQNQTFSFFFESLTFEN